jgi:hypothetical protein
MSILTQLFGGNKAQQQAPQQPGQQGQQGQQPNQHIQANQTVPNGTEPGANPNGGTEQTQSPNDKFKELWSNTNQPTSEAPNFKLDPAQLGKVTGSMDFMKNINREDLGKIAQGGESAIEALGNVLNTFGREVFGASAQFSSHMTESGYQSASKVIDNGLPSAIKRQLTEQHLYQANPKLKDPALQPLIGALQTQFTSKYPNASAQEIEGLVSEYMTTVVGGAFTKEEPAARQQAKAAPDFSSFL